MMKKLMTLVAVCAATMAAQAVGADWSAQYSEPVYNTAGVAASGIDHWDTMTIEYPSADDNVFFVESSEYADKWGTAGVTNWYVVTNGTFQIDGGVSCSGHVKLLLCEGAKLVVTNVYDDCPGIETDADGSLTIYGQPTGAGELQVYGGYNAAGIGGGFEVEGSHVTINGGTVMVTAGYCGAAIGGGYDAAGSDIVINGGSVTANSGESAAGIGGGSGGDGTDITINGGIVKANGVGAGIGGGDGGAGENITINGGDVTAIGGDLSAAIGGGYLKIGRNISINGGTVRVAALVSGIDSCAGELVGSSYQYASESENITISDQANVFFNMTGIYYSGETIDPAAPMPDTFEGLVIMTSETQRWSRVMTSGLTNPEELSARTWTITNAVTGATTNIAVNAEDHLDFANRYLRLTEIEGVLTLAVEPPSLTIWQMPDAENAYTIVATTDGSDGILNYAWCISSAQILDFHSLTNRLNPAFDSNHGVIEGTSISSASYGQLILFWNYEDLPSAGELRFTGPSDLTDASGGMCGELQQGEGDSWTFTPVETEALGPRGYCLPLMCSSANFAISNLSYSCTVFTSVAEGATLTQFPTEGKETGTYLCRMTYGHHGVNYTDTSGKFEYSAGTPVAEIVETGTQFTSLQEAVDTATKGQTVRLIADIDLALNNRVELPEGAELTLDLNGKKINFYTDTSYSAIYIQGSGKLTIDDTAGGGGIFPFDSNTEGNCAHILYSDGDADLTVNGGTFASTNEIGTVELFVKNAGGTWNFNGGTYIAVSETGHAIALYLADACGNTAIAGGTFDVQGKGWDGQGICTTDGSTDWVEVNGGVFTVETESDTWGSAFCCRNGTFVFNGGTFNVVSEQMGCSCVEAIFSGTVIISNGTFAIESSAEYAYCAKAASGGNLTIAGGTFDATSAGGTTATVDGEGANSRVTIVGEPVINDSEGGWNLAIQMQDACSLDLTGYTGKPMTSLGVINGEPSYVKGDIIADFADYRSLYNGYYSVRPNDDDAQGGALVMANIEEATSNEYPWKIGAAVAEIASGARFATVQDAINAAVEGDKVLILEDVNENVTVAAEKDLSIDLNGHIFNSANEGEPVIRNFGTLVITDCHYGDSEEYTHCLTEDGDGWIITNEWTEIQFYGGCITGGRAGDVENGGCGISNDGTLTLEAGTICGNCKDGGGAGVRNGGTFTMNGGEICYNYATESGGGVSEDGTITTIAGGKIHHNKAGSTWGIGQGGGIAVGSNARLDVTGGEIYENFAGQNGGGIAVFMNSTFNLTGGEITSNTSYIGGGIGSLGTSTIGGAVVVKNNVAAELCANLGVVSNIGGAFTESSETPLADGADIGVSLVQANSLTEFVSIPGTFLNSASAEDAQYFTSDDTTYAVRFLDGHLELFEGTLIAPPSGAGVTFTIYTNGVPIAESRIAVEKGIPAYVVYETDDRYYFEGGKTVVTNQCDTTVNPATMDGPSAPAYVTVGTYDELVEAIDSTALRIIFTADITAEDTLTVPEERAVSIEGDDHVLTVPVPGASEIGVLNDNASGFSLLNNSGNLTITDLTMRGGSTTCICNSENGALKMLGCTIERSGNAETGGGGLCNYGKCYMKDCKISRNNAAYGGGFQNDNNGILVMDSCSLNENRSLTTGCGGGGGQNNGLLVVNNSTFANNTSTEIGGAINNYNGKSYVFNTTFVGNIADHDDIGTKCGGAFGLNGGEFYSANLLMVNNYAKINGGSSSEISDFRDCDVGIYSEGGTIGSYGDGYGTVRTGDGDEDVMELDYSKHIATNDVFVSYRQFGVLNPDGTSGEALFNRPVITLCANGTYLAPLKLGSEAATGATNSYVYIPEDVSTFSTETIRLGVGTDDDITAVGEFAVAEAADKVTTYQDGSPRAAGVIGSAYPTDSVYFTLTIKATENGTVTGDGSLYGDTYEEGTLVSVTAVPNEGYGPVGWLVNGEDEPSVTENPYEFQLMEDTVLEPVFGEVWTVSFNVLDHGTAPASQYFTMDATPPGKATRPDDPSAEGYDFGGWFVTPACREEDEYDFNTDVTSDLELFAKWTATTPQTPPPAPIVKDPDNFTSGGFTANWSVTSRAIKYEIKVFEDAACEEEAVRTTTNDFTSTSAEFTGLESEGLYFYRVWAIDQNDMKSEASGIMPVQLPHACEHGTFFTRIETEEQLVELFAGGNGYLAADITLTDDLRFLENEAATVELCLNGHVLDLGGHRILCYSEQTLRIYDCNTTTFRGFGELKDGCWAYDSELTESTATHKLYGGLVTGGGSEGAICCDDGSLTIRGVNIAGNDATAGNVVYYSDWNGYTFDLANVTICGNYASEAAVRVSSGSEVALVGKMTVTNNAGGANLSLYRYDSDDMATLYFDEEDLLDEESVIGVTLDSGYGDFSISFETSYEAQFFSDDASYGVGYNEEKKLYLYDSTSSATITFNAGSGENPPAAITGKHIGENFTFPEAGDMTRAGYTFNVWMMENGNRYAPGATSPTIESEDVQVLALWKLVITQQPTYVNDYTVGVGTEDKIAYQWCKQAETLLKDGVWCDVYCATFDSEANVIIKNDPYEPIDIDIYDRKEGTILTFTSTEGSLEGAYATVLTKTGPVAGVYTYSYVFEGSDACVYIDGGEEGTTLENLKLYDYNPVEGQTTPTLTEGENGSTYLCQLTYDEDQTVSTDPAVYIDGDYVTFTPEAVEHTTVTVFTDDKPVEKTGDIYLLPSNGVSTVVYTAYDGYVFDDESTAVTNQIDATVEPAQAKAPSAPVITKAIAKIVETEEMFPSVQQAVNATKAGETVQMLTNSVENVYIEEEYDLTLDLNGFVLGADDTTRHVIMNNGTLVVTDSRYGDKACAHYLATTDGLVWSIVEEETEDVVYGGCITGARTSWSADGAGVRNDGDMTLAAGIICGNGISDGGDSNDGGGLSNRGNFTMTGGEICYNYAEHTGGAMIEFGYSTISGGKIHHNRAGDSWGSGEGGAITIDEGCGLRMTGGEIYENLAGADSGGIAIAMDATFEMTGGAITNNTAYVGGGIGSLGSATIGGTAVVTENTAIDCAPNLGIVSNIGGGPFIRDSDTPFAAGANIGVTLMQANSLTEFVPVEGPFLLKAEESDAAYFTSDDSSFSIRYNDVEGQLELYASAETSTIEPEDVDNATYVIYVDDKPVEDPYIEVDRDTPAYVVYTADPGYAFSKDVTVVTNQCDTSVDPAEVAAPDAPGKIVSDIPCSKEEDTVVIPVEKPAAVDEKVWDKATNIVGSVMTLDAAVIVADKVLTNTVDDAKQKFEISGTNVTRVIALVDIAVQPLGVEADSMGAIRKVKMDVTPWLTTFAEVSDGVTVSTNKIADATKDFEFSGEPMMIAFYVEDLASEPMLIVHTHDGVKYNYIPGDNPTESTFVYDSKEKYVVLQMSRFSELEIYSDIQVGETAYARIVNGDCTIYGTGAMWDKSDWPSGHPLASYKTTIRNVSVSDGVTTIGSQFFAKFYALTNISCAASVTTVGAGAFSRCLGIERMAFEGEEPTFGDKSFTIRAGIRMEGGQPVIWPIPEVTYGGNEPTLYGKAELTDPEWVIVTDENKANMRFFTYEQP